jgi:hypothetical protein
MKTFESYPSEEHVLEHFEKLFREKEDITLQDLSKMKKLGISTEKFLTYLHKKHKILFHGSRAKISIGDKIKSISRDVVFASSDPAIAILKAIYLNNAGNLGYPMQITENRDNLALEIEGPKSDTIGEKGFVYIISDTADFESDPNSNWQFAKNDTEKIGVPFLKRIEVEKSDFNYPVKIK